MRPKVPGTTGRRGAEDRPAPGDRSRRAEEQIRKIGGEGNPRGDEEERMKIQIKTVETGGFSMEYACFGSGGDTLVILPGLSLQSVLRSAAAVAGSYHLLTRDFTVYLFDRRKEIPPVYPVHRIAEDTCVALKALGMEKVCLFGASLGGMMAMDLAINHPEMVRRLAVASAPAQVSRERFQRIARWIELAEGKKTEELYLDFGRALYPAAVFNTIREAMAELAKTVTEEELKHFVIQARGIKNFDIRKDLEKIKCPFLVTGSKDDRVLGGEAGSQIASCLAGRPDFEIHLYSEYGHACYDTAPDFKQRLLRFMTGKP